MVTGCAKQGWCHWPLLPTDIYFYTHTQQECVCRVLHKIYRISHLQTLCLPPPAEIFFFFAAKNSPQNSPPAFVSAEDSVAKLEGGQQQGVRVCPQNLKRVCTRTRPRPGQRQHIVNHRSIYDIIKYFASASI